MTPQSSVMFIGVIFLFFPVSIDGSSSFDAEAQILMDTGTLSYSLSVQSEPAFRLDEKIDSTIDVETEVTFHLFTKANKESACLLRVGDLKSVAESPFDSECPTKVIVHGWTDSVETYWYNTYRNNYLATGDYNVILVDWSSGARKEYFTSAKLTRPVGEYLGKLLAFLVENGNMSLSSLHILGHSLGAHIAGIAGSSLSGRVGRVTGMDPAGPAFEVPFPTDPRDRLDPTDAKFVDVIHTCSGTAGFISPIGHADFYPNGGTFPQPGCPPIMSQFCSHARSHQFMSESILRPKGFLSLRCESWREYVSGHCGPDDVTAFMGEMLSQAARGNFYLRTNSQPPFGRSNFGSDEI